MLITCDNVGCLQMSNAKIKVETNEVMCQECGKVINNVSEMMKRVLSSSGEIVRDNQRKAFTMGCKSCNANRQVVLDEDDNTVCSVCANAINVHPAMKQAILEVGEKLKRASDKTTKKAAKKKKVKKKAGK